MVDSMEEKNDGGGFISNSSSVAVNNEEKSGPDISGVVLGGRDEGYTGCGLNLSSVKNLEPRERMSFDSKKEAFSFYKEYARSVGFSTIRKASRRSRKSGKFIDAIFVCNKYGNKRESTKLENSDPVPVTDNHAVPARKKRGRVNQSWSKTDCKACMHVKRRDDGRWIVSSFIKEHNHEIFPNEAFRDNRNSEIGIDSLNAICERSKGTASTSRQSRGYKKSRNNGKHLNLDEGDTRVMLEYFISMQDENRSFFYAMDLNEEQRLRNVFWMDAKSRLDYSYFDDVVSFDTTYITKGCKLPFAPFLGQNHHCQPLILGCALIADATKSTYVWLMRAWLRAIGGRAPKVILSDQYKALKEAIAEVFPDSRHCFCLWHALSKIPEKLGYFTTQHESFVRKFNKRILKSLTIEQI